MPKIMERLGLSRKESSQKSGFASRLAGRVALVGVAAMGVASTAEAVSAEPAQAVAYTDYVRSPKLNGTEITGKAKINTDCEDTYGCWSYIKLQKSEYDDADLNGKFVAGHWAEKDGMNTVTATIGDCAFYRTVVDTYNKQPRQSAVSVNLGPVSIGADGLGMYHDKSVSDYKYLCPQGNGGGGW